MKKSRREIQRMYNNLRVASIDIGSNAIRLFIGQNTKSGRVRILKDSRVSIRLGKDAFGTGRIRPITQRELKKVLEDFRKTCEQLRVQHIRAVGTSALRDSRNGKHVVQKLKTSTGISVQVIHGVREANLLYRAVSHVVDLRHRNALLMDMGGGSLEVVVIRQGRVRSLKSLPLGTVRLLSRVPHGQYEDYARWVRMPLYRLGAEIFGRHEADQLLVGTGGNLRAIGKLCYRLGLSRTRSRFSRSHLEVLTRKLFQMTLQQRMKRFQLKRDRADVILPAVVVTLELMRIFDIENINVPNVGIKNGLYWESLDKLKQKI